MSETEFPLMAAKIMQLVKDDPKVVTPPFGSPDYAMLMLTGVPVEELAESLNKRYLHETSRGIAQLRETSRPWNPEAWAVVCSPWVFEGWEAIDQVPVLHTCPIPWAIFLVQPAVWQGTLRLDQKGIRDALAP